MKKFLLSVLLIVTVCTLVYGNSYWEGRLKVVYADHQREKAPVLEKEMKDKERKGVDLLLLDKINYLPKELQGIFRGKVEKGKPVELAIIGTASTSESGWPMLLTKALFNTYGEELIQVNTKQLANKTSSEIINERLLDEMVAAKPDILLLEPFLLYDNTKIEMNQRLKNLSVMIEQFKSSNPDVMIMIQPANPIYDAHYYPKEEKELEKYAKAHQYVYIDHWSAWPKGDSKELLKYLSEEGLPNEKGNEVWADYLKKYFIQIPG